jgi:bifunctional UDP-N-acetylglucosamine pyrophosphorylase/glucosamine-1-phosphate N-acetyltransferase
MRSDLPKVLHRAAGKPLIMHVIQAVQAAGIEDIIIVVGHGREKLKEALADSEVRFAVQEEQLGTGHALAQVQGLVDDDATLLVLAGDTPLLQASTLEAVLTSHREQQAVATVLSCQIDDPGGYGRIIRSPEGRFRRIVEEKDASPEEKAIHEINSGIYCFQSAAAFQALARVGPGNAQGEYYLTDILEILNSENQRVAVCQVNAPEEIHGVNDRVQLARAERLLRERKNRELMLSGVTIIDPNSTVIDADVKIGPDTIIYPGTIIEGGSQVGENCEIGPFTHINDSCIGKAVKIESSRIKEARVADSCTIGPFAYLRPETVLAEEVKVGDFVEIKKSVIGRGSKVPHLSYVGDALVGEEVNIGAGTITCNYDGRHKHQTILEDHVFIGSNTNLVAPIRIGEHSMTGAGSTITRDVPPHSLAVERADQKNRTRHEESAKKE